VARSARAFTALGYSEALAHLDGKLSRPEAVARTAQLTRRYAKRQMTWFRREPGVEWFEGFGGDPQVRSRVLAWLAHQLER
jgi:tRNA dimethylallyltransferase